MIREQKNGQGLEHRRNTVLFCQRAYSAVQYRYDQKNERGQARWGLSSLKTPDLSYLKYLLSKPKKALP